MYFAYTDFTYVGILSAFVGRTRSNELAAAAADEHWKTRNTVRSVPDESREQSRPQWYSGYRNARNSADRATDLGIYRPEDGGAVIVGVYVLTGGGESLRRSNAVG